jgi:hypothetical protein
MRERVARGDQLDPGVAGEEGVGAEAGGEYENEQRQKNENRRTRRERRTPSAPRLLPVLRFNGRSESPPL